MPCFILIIYEQYFINLKLLSFEDSNNLYLYILKYSTDPMPSKTKYNPFRIPYNVTTALDHRSATSSGIPTQSSVRCSCCILPIHQTPLPINFDSKQLKHLGRQYSWFYDYCKLVGILLLLVMFDSGISQFQDALKSSSQVSQVFGINWSSLSPLYPAQKFILYSSLSFVSIAFFLFAAQIFMRYRLEAQANQSAVGQQNWSVLLRNVPKTENAQEKIRDLLKMNFNNIQIKEIIMISNMEKYQQAENQIKKQVAEWKQLLKNEQKKKQEILGALKKIDLSTKKFHEVRQQLRLNKNQNFSQSAIVVFETKENQLEVLKALETNFFTKNKVEASFGEVNLNDNQIIVAEAAPSPSQIDWQNISKPQSQMQANTRINHILLFFMYVCFYLVLFSAELCTGRRIKENKANLYNMTPIMVILSILSYTLMPFVIRVLQKRQGCISQTQNLKETMIKLSLSFVVIRIFIILAVQSTFMEGSEVAHSTINKIFILLISDLAVSTIFWLINPQDILKRILKLIYRNRNTLTQQQAIQLYTRPTHNLPLKYSYVLAGFWSAIMLSNLIPVVGVLMFASLFFFYWIDKFNLARRSSVSYKAISDTFLQFFVRLMPFALILKPLTNLILWSIAKQSIAIPQLIMLLLGITYNVIPKEKLIIKVLSILKYQQKSIDYLYNQQKMQTLYSLENPITGSLQKKIQFLSKKRSEVIKFAQDESNGKNIDATDTIKDKIVLNSQPQPDNMKQPDQGNAAGVDEGKESEEGGNYQPGHQDTDRNMVNS